MHYTARHQDEPESDEARDARRTSLLHALGAAVRARREGSRITRRALATVARVSERFLAQVELGEGNVSVARLDAIARSLGASAAELLAEAERASTHGEEAKGRGPGVVALLGLRGAGKSTIGTHLAKRLGVAFVELDQLIASAAGMTVGAILEIHGEAYFRRLERETLARFLERTDRAVLATSGSIVTDADTYALLRRRARTVWLKARPKDHWDRVVAQGDGRPMKGRPGAMAELRALLEARMPLYAKADITLDTSARGIKDATRTIAEAVGATP
jgi:XRE family aerobic/anaerobic benzoate catabolism transcriptional regulator